MSRTIHIRLVRATAFPYRIENAHTAMPLHVIDNASSKSKTFEIKFDDGVTLHTLMLTLPEGKELDFWTPHLEQFQRLLDIEQRMDS